MKPECPAEPVHFNLIQEKLAGILPSLINISDRPIGSLPSNYLSPLIAIIRQNSLALAGVASYLSKQAPKLGTQDEILLAIKEFMSKEATASEVRRKMRGRGPNRLPPAPIIKSVAPSVPPHKPRSIPHSS